MFESSDVKELDEATSRALLGTVPVGRVAFTEHGLPAIHPVNFTVLGKSIIFRTSAGSKLYAIAKNNVVAFHADDIDPEQQTGWSVTAVGVAEEITDPTTLAALRRVALTPWAPGPRDRYIRILVNSLTGMRIVRDDRA